MLTDIVGPNPPFTPKLDGTVFAEIPITQVENAVDGARRWPLPFNTAAHGQQHERRDEYVACPWALVDALPHRGQSPPGILAAASRAATGARSSLEIGFLRAPLSRACPLYPFREWQWRQSGGHP